MKSLKNIPEQIMWHDGMLLSPQHFQQAFKRSENIYKYQFFQNIPYPFGVKTFTFDENTFTNGLLKVEELECTFQDGLEYYFNSSKDKETLEFDLTKYKDILSKKPVTLVICVPKNKTNNYILNSSNSRFKSVNIDSYSIDENTGEDEIYIPRIKPNVSFMLEHEISSNFIAIPIAQVYLENSFYKTKLFCPPTTSITQESPIWKISNSVCLLLRYKIQDIIADIYKFDNEEYKGTFFNRRQALKTMKACLPRLEASIHSNQLHPFQLYLELYNVYAHISSNDIDENPKSLVPYNHFNLLETFELINNYIIEYLEREIPTGFNVTKISKIDKKFQSTILTKENTLDNNTHILIGLKKSYSVSEENFINWIKSSIICEEENLSMVVERRSLGLSRSIIEKYENLIPKKNIYLVYVKLDNIKKDKINIVISSSVNENIHYLPEEVIIYSRKA